MGAGLFLIVVGAILAFAVTDHVQDVNLGVVGLILMIAGAAVIANAKRDAVTQRIVTRRDHDGETVDEVDEVVRHNDVDDVHRRGSY